MGLLDYQDAPDPLLNFGMGLLSASGPSRMPISAGQAIATGWQAMRQGQRDRLDNDLLRQQIQGVATSNRLHQAAADQAARELEKQKWLESTAQRYYRPAQSPAEQALSIGAKFGSVGPTVNNSALLPSAMGTPAGFDQQGFTQDVMQKYPMLGMQLQAEARKAGQVTLKKDEVVYDAGGKRLFGNEQPDLQFVQGDGYQPDRMFDKNSGRLNLVNPLGAPSPVQAGANPNDGGQYDQNAPWRHMPPKEQDAFRKSIYEQESKKLNDIRSAVSRGRDVLSDLDRFGGLNRETATGGLYDKLAPFNWHLGTNENEMVAIQNRLGPMARPAGAGSTSNWEGLQYLSALPGIDKPGPANQAIRADYQRRFDLALRELQFKEDYLAKHGHLNGADSAFQGTLQSPSATTLSPSAVAPKLTGNGKLLNAQQREALGIVIKSGDPSLIAQARKKGWIE